MTEKSSSGEGIGYFGEVEVVTLRMNTRPECRQANEVVNPVEKAILLMEVEMEVNGEFNLGCWTSDMILRTQKLDPDCKTSKEGTVTQEFD